MCDPIQVICSSSNSLLNSITTALTAISAVTASIFAFLSYRMYLNEKREEEAKKQIFHGKLTVPSLKESSSEYSKCVLTCSLFNKSSQRAYIEAIEVNVEGSHIDTTWSNKVSNTGMPINPNRFIEISGVEDMYIRRTDGELFGVCSVIITHSFSKKPLVIKFDFSR